MTPIAKALALSTSLALAPSIAACDDRQAFERPDPTFARMLQQRRADPLEASRAFADGKVMQRPPPNTIPTDDDRDDPEPPMSRDLFELGRTSFDVTCATCHGVTGDGDSVVATKMERRRPPSLHEARVRALSRARVVDVVTEGYGLMPSFADVLTRRERWAVAAYVQALQLGRRAPVSELPIAVQRELAEKAP